MKKLLVFLIVMVPVVFACNNDPLPEDWDENKNGIVAPAPEIKVDSVKLDSTNPVIRN